MNVVLVHIGATGPFIDSTALPSYLGDCIRQYSLFNESKLYVLTDRENIEGLQDYEQVIPVPLEDYYSDKIPQLCALYNYPERNFWTVSITRFVYLENFLRENNLQHVYHFENDILIYFDISKFHHLFKQLYSNIAITPGGLMKTMTGFMYIDNYRSLGHMMDFFIDVLTKLGTAGECEQYKFDMTHEMSLMWAYNREWGPRHMAYLPILPFGAFSQNFDKFNAIFDPASWGQLVGGTRWEGPGARLADSYVGQVLKAHPQYDVAWKTEGNLKIPYFGYDGNLVKINNLHIHSKNLSPYTSKE